MGNEITKRPIVLVGETGKRETLRALRRLGWGRMFVDKEPQPFDGERWGFDNRAFIAWKNGTAWDGDAYKRRLDRARIIPIRPYLAVVPDIVAAGKHSLEFSLEWHEKLANLIFSLCRHFWVRVQTPSQP